MHRQECLVAAMLDVAFAMAVYQDGALFGLSRRDTADVDQCLDDIVESMHIVVVEHQGAARVFHDGGLVIGLWGGEGAVGLHEMKIEN